MWTAGLGPVAVLDPADACLVSACIGWQAARSRRSRKFRLARDVRVWLSLMAARRCAFRLDRSLSRVYGRVRHPAAVSILRKDRAKGVSPCDGSHVVGHQLQDHDPGSEELSSGRPPTRGSLTRRFRPAGSSVVSLLSGPALFRWIRASRQRRERIVAGSRFAAHGSSRLRLVHVIPVLAGRIS